MREVTQEQPAPVPNASRPIWDLVIEDMKQIDQKGRKSYGTPLQAFNGRDALVDAYQEALDLAVYLRQAIEERKIVNARERKADPDVLKRAVAYVEQTDYLNTETRRAAGNGYIAGFDDASAR